MSDRKRRSQPLAERGLPYDDDAEVGACGSVFLLPIALDSLEHMLREDDFYNRNNGAIWAAMLTLAHAGMPLDPILLTNQIRADGHWKSDDNQLGIDSLYLSRVIHAVPNAAHANYYAEIVAEKSRLRKIIRHCTQALTDAYTELPSRDVIDGLELRLSAVENPDLQEAVTMAEAARTVIDRLASPNDTSNRCETGIPSVDSMIGPIMAGEIAVIAARTSLGKSSLTQQILVHSAQRGQPALLVSLEMKAKELATRELCKRAGVDSRVIRRGNVGHTVINSLNDEHQNLVGLPLHIWSPPRATVSEIRSVARKIQARDGLALLAVDLIGLVSPEKEYAKHKREEQLRNISSGLKAIGAELNIPIIFVAQLNRDADGEEPRLSHLRDSGRLEEDADLVLLLHHDKKVVSADWRHQKRNLIMAKHRNGQVGKLEIGWHPILTTFTDIDVWPENEV